MARKRQGETAYGGPRALTPPGLFLIRMLIFLTLVGFLIAILHEQLIRAIMSNPGLNGLIIGVLAFGLLYSFRQVIRLYPEIRWVNAFRIADPGLTISHKPRLLLPMATMLRDRTGWYVVPEDPKMTLKKALEQNPPARPPRPEYPVR